MPPSSSSGLVDGRLRPPRPAADWYRELLLTKGLQPENSLAIFDKKDKIQKESRNMNGKQKARGECFRTWRGKQQRTVLCDLKGYIDFWLYAPSRRGRHVMGVGGQVERRIVDKDVSCRSHFWTQSEKQSWCSVLIIFITLPSTFSFIVPRLDSAKHGIPAQQTTKQVLK